MLANCGGVGLGCAWLWCLRLQRLSAKDARAHRFPARLTPRLHARYGDALYSQDDEETLIRAFFDDRRNGVFLDVGAGESGEEQHTYYLEKHLGWRGIAVDALTEYAPTMHAAARHALLLLFRRRQERRQA